MDIYAPAYLALPEMSAQKFNVVALGDSWFDYPPAFFHTPLGGDLIARLGHCGRFSIKNFGKAGDTLQNMAYGTDVNHDYSPKPGRINEVLGAVKSTNADVFLLSAGGNDFSGDDGVELEQFLNHGKSGLPVFREDRARETFNVYVRTAQESIIKAVTAARPGIQIFLHGYDYAMPDGRSVIDGPGNFDCVGPWLIPAFARQQVWPASDRFKIVRQLVDMHNENIACLAQAYSNVHHIDCRGVLDQTTDDWANELHPTPKGWEKIAQRFEGVIGKVMGI